MGIKIIEDVTIFEEKLTNGILGNTFFVEVFPDNQPLLLGGLSEQAVTGFDDLIGDLNEFGDVVEAIIDGFLFAGTGVFGFSEYLGFQSDELAPKRTFTVNARTDAGS